MKKQTSEQRWDTVKNKRRSDGTTQPTGQHTNGRQDNIQDQPHGPTQSGIDSAKKREKSECFDHQKQERQNGERTTSHTRVTTLTTSQRRESHYQTIWNYGGKNKTSYGHVILDRTKTEQFQQPLQVTGTYTRERAETRLGSGFKKTSPISRSVEDAPGEYTHLPVETDVSFTRNQVVSHPLNGDSFALMGEKTFAPSGRNQGRSFQRFLTYV